MGKVSNTDLVTYSIKCEGKQIKDTIGVISITIEFATNRISMARLELIDGIPAEQKFELSESDQVNIGATIEIFLGYHTEDKLIFSGIIISQGISLEEDGTSRLIAECRGKEVKMTIGRKTVVHNTGSAIKDNTVLQKLLSDYSLNARVASSTVELKQLVQHYCTDWDFLLTRAEANGWIVTPTPKQLIIGEPNTSQSPVLTLEYGSNLRRFNLEIDSRSQYKAVSGQFWDEYQQKNVAFTAKTPSVNVPGKDQPGALAEVMAQATFGLSSAAPLLVEEAQQWADGQLTKSYLSKLRGTLVCEGTDLVVPGAVVELKGLGSRFNGTAYVSGVRHVVEEGDWSTEITVGLDSTWFVEKQPDVIAPVSSPLLPGIQGLYHGVVTKTQGDPEEHFRVEVQIPSMNNKALWARLSQSFASDSYGSFIYPDVDDEVILGFMGGDPRFPVILGSLYSKKRKPVYTPDEKNTKKGWKTKEGLTIELDAEKKMITIQTPAMNKFILDDSTKSILLQDQHGNKIELGEAGITLSSKSAITLSADGDISIQASKGATVTAKTSLQLDAASISGQAKGEIKLQGNGSAQLSSSAVVVVKGAIVQIN